MTIVLSSHQTLRCRRSFATSLVVLLVYLAKTLSMELYYPEGLLLNILESKPNFSDVDEEEKSQVR